MKKKVLATILTAALAISSLAGCGAEKTTEGGSTETTQSSSSSSSSSSTSTEAGDTTITIWVAEAVVDFTKAQAENWKAANADYANFTINVEATGEGDAAGNMLTDVKGGADIYGFAQDQLARLVSAGALASVEDENKTFVQTANDAGAVGAATVGDTVYAYPLTSDNGYFLYYDKSVVTDPTSLEAVIADCEAAGKNFYFEINSGWYQTAFFFATGAELTYDTDDEGNFTQCNISYDSPAGLVAIKEMVEVASSPSFQNGSSVSNGTNIGAIVDGTWDASAAKELFGDNYACAKLPTFTGSDGKSYQLSGFGGFKLLGVKPQTDATKLAACNSLAAYLSSEEVQIARYNEVFWGPSNLNAQADPSVQADEALAALAQQLAFTIPQGQYPGDYWSLATALGDDIVATGVLNSSSTDEELQSALAQFQETCISYAQ